MHKFLLSAHCEHSKDQTTQSDVFAHILTSFLKFIPCLKVSSECDSSSGCSCCRTQGCYQLWRLALLSQGLLPCREELDMAHTCSFSLVHQKTSQYQILIQLPVPHSRSAACSLTASPANTRLKRLLPENHP